MSMLSLTPLSGRSYDVDVWGSVADPLDRVQAAQAYAQSLEAQLGGPEALMRCFLAAQSEEKAQQGADKSPASKDAQAWVRAHRHAAHVAERFMQAQPPPAFVLQPKPGHAAA
ncbi:hypothetical protein PGB34_11170 [Xenophilus arseniciresistens]|uniref:Uncharacterized protein n=1 Tax=Xenophilus arseniciresistens TaxID=1283306 RepID=A0AAE3N8A1_9BURK|nr:hypothetical protein [Xenophilus arseniciresistens]MDA7416926.1 hypothetical protein [Xenophilus arseniciresistens]